MPSLRKRSSSGLLGEQETPKKTRKIDSENTISQRVIGKIDQDKRKAKHHEHNLENRLSNIEDVIEADSIEEEMPLHETEAMVAKLKQEWIERYEEKKKTGYIPRLLKGYCCKCSRTDGFLRLLKTCLNCTHPLCGTCTDLEESGDQDEDGELAFGDDEIERQEEEEQKELW